MVILMLGDHTRPFLFRSSHIKKKLKIF